MSPGAGTWRATAATARGSSHDRSGAPNQDAHAVTSAHGDGTRWVAVVADGHGGQRYVRSDRGSRLAADLASRIGLELLTARGSTASSAAAELPRRLLPAWRAAVIADVTADPFTAEEQVRAGADLGVAPLIAYGATLIAVFVDRDLTAVAQIGDGDVVLRAAGSVRRPVPGDDRLVAGETTSLCLPTAEADFRFSTTADADLVLVATDGYGNSFADPDWHTTVFSDLGTQLDRDGLEPVAAALPEWVADSARVGGDDVSVILLSRAAPPHAPVTGTRRSLRSGLLAGFLVALVGAGLLVGSQVFATPERSTPAPVDPPPVVLTTGPAATPTPTAASTPRATDRASGQPSASDRMTERPGPAAENTPTRAPRPPQGSTRTAPPRSAGSGSTAGTARQTSPVVQR